MKLLSLVNNSNHCYINSVLQCIFNNRDFVNYLHTNAEYIITFKNILDINDENMTKLIGINVIKMLTNVIYKLHSLNNNDIENQLVEDVIKVDFVELKKLIQRRFGFNNQYFIGQQDVHEFIVKLFDYIHIGLIVMGLETNIGTIINQLFGGSLKDILICKHCFNVLRKETHYDSLILEIPIVDIPDNNTIKQCIDKLFDQEILDDYKCEKCQKIGTVVKKTIIIKSPQTLICVFKRFNNNQQKMQKKIITTPNLQLSISYSLNGIISHVGSNIRFGHYVACVKKENNKWYGFNDEIVQRDDNNDYLTLAQDSYVLFYNHIIN